MSTTLKQFSCSQIINSKKSTKKSESLKRSQVKEKCFSRSSASTSSTDSNQRISASGYRTNSSQPSNSTISRNVSKVSSVFSPNQVSTDLETIQEASDKFFVVFLPYIKSDNHKQIKQPLLLQVEKNKFKGFEFNSSKKLFRMKIGRENVDGQIIATGDEYSKVKINLGKAIVKNQELKDCLTIIGNLSFMWPIECVSTENSQIEPNYLVLDLQAFENFLLSFKSDRGVSNQLRKRKDKESAKETQSQVKEKHLKKRESINDQSFSVGQDSSTGIATEIASSNQKEIPYSKENEKCSCSSITDKLSKENSLNQLGKVRDRLMERKQVLSQLDLPSLIMADLIECIDNIHEVLSVREKETKKVEQKIPDEDKTFKDKKKDLIFVEGILPFKSDSYKKAILSGKGNPLTLAYQLVKSCFPESYYLNVTLGKRFYEADEMKEFLKLRESNDTKFPLPFVWGFKNPIEEPFQGEFDLKLGLERVQALIVHILRKCDILELDENLVKNIRGRLVRELNARNAAYRTKQNSTGTQNKERDQDLDYQEFGDIYTEMPQLDFEQDSTHEEESDKNPISFIWDSDEILTD